MNAPLNLGLLVKYPQPILVQNDREQCFRFRCPECGAQMPILRFRIEPPDSRIYITAVTSRCSADCLYNHLDEPDSEPYTEAERLTRARYPLPVVPIVIPVPRVMHFVIASDPGPMAEMSYVTTSEYSSARKRQMQIDGALERERRIMAEDVLE